jgi:U32 family peptidase
MNSGPSHPIVPELLSPAGSLDAVRAAVGGGADAVYLGVERFNARDEGAQLTLNELAEACRLAHARGRRIYLTLNILLKPAELADALELLGEAIDRGIDAVIVQDLGLVRLIRRVYPDLSIHGSTQITVHDESGASLLAELGVERVVLARENTLDDIRAITSAVPSLSFESFIHGALCVAYSGQCFMSGMISERSANRGSCAQSCRKDYVLTDAKDGSELDRGYLISAKDLAAHEHLREIAEAGIRCLKIEGRKKRPEYVATVTQTYRGFLERLRKGEPSITPDEEVAGLVQIYSRGFTGGMYGGREGREYVTRTQPDNRGVVVGTVAGYERGELLIDVLDATISQGDGLGFEAPDSRGGPSIGFVATAVRTAGTRPTRQAIRTTTRVAKGWRVVRTSNAALLERSRASYAGLSEPQPLTKARLDVRVFGSNGAHLKAHFSCDGDTVEVRSEQQLVPASKRALDRTALREHFGRLGDTAFVLGALDVTALAADLFLPISQLNHMKQRAVEELLARRGWNEQTRRGERRARIDASIERLESLGNERPATAVPSVVAPEAPFALVAQVFRLEDAEAAAAAGATEIVLDPFLRHPAPPLSRVRALRESLAARGTALRLRTPTIVRPEERRSIQKWLDLGLPVLTGHLGLVGELSRAGRDVVADYAVNVMNQHTAALVFGFGARRVVLSVELTANEMSRIVAPWDGRGFDVFLYGRPEGMTIEHCVLSAAFDREPTTCRDLCVQKHTDVYLTDPAGYSFPVATDAACRNRLLHSRPIEGSEFLPRLREMGIRGYHVVFNTPGDPISEIVARYRRQMDALSVGHAIEGELVAAASVRDLLGTAFTRGHFSRAV